MKKNTLPSENHIFPLEEENEWVSILMKFWGIFRRYWYWFAGSLLVSLTMGYIYQQRQDRVYKGEAVILIDESSGGTSGGIRSRSRNNINTLMQLNGISVGDNLKNEIFILSSLRLMKNVVSTLGLEMDYTTAKGLHQVALYKERPFSLEFEQPAQTYARVEATINEDNTVTLTNFYEKGEISAEEQEEKINLAPGVRTKTPIGFVTLRKERTFAQFPRGKSIEVHHYSNENAAIKYKTGIRVAEHSKESSLLVLTFMDINKARAKDVLNEICRVYKADIVDNKNRVAQSTANFIDARLQLISKELSQVEQRLASFKQNNSIVDLQSTAATMTQHSLVSQQKTLELETQLSVARHLSDFLKSSSNEKEVIPAIGNFNNATLTQQIGEYNRMLLNRNRFAINANEETPAIKELDRQLSSLRNAIQASLNSQVKSLELELKSAQTAQNDFAGQVSRVPAKEKEVLDIARQQNLKEALYTFLLNRREEVALQLAIEETNVRVVEEPMLTHRPIAPRTSTIMIIALLVGIILPSLAFWILDLLDTTISNRADVERVLNIPIAGELPNIKKADDNTLVYSEKTAQDSPSAEAFRMLRYGLHFMNKSAKVYLLTSATPGQGKSFVSRNLASAMAMTKKRVLLIDADIRKQTLSSNFSSPHLKGLTEYLVGDCEDHKELIVPNQITQGVDFLPAGMLPPNTSELLMSERLEQLLKRLRQDYDYIFIDTTPCFAVADANIASRVADVTLFVMRVGVQSKHNLESVRELHRTKKLGNLCLVINDCDIKARVYGYGYGYGYGYAPQDNNKKRWWRLWT